MSRRYSLRVGIIESGDWWGPGGTLRLQGRSRIGLVLVGILVALVTRADVAVYDLRERLVWGPW